MRVWHGERGPAIAGAGQFAGCGYEADSGRRVGSVCAQQRADREESSLCWDVDEPDGGERDGSDQAGGKLLLLLSLCILVCCSYLAAVVHLRGCHQP